MCLLWAPLYMHCNHWLVLVSAKCCPRLRHAYPFPTMKNLTDTKAEYFQTDIGARSFTENREVNRRFLQGDFPACFSSKNMASRENTTKIHHKIHGKNKHQVSQWISRKRCENLMLVNSFKIAPLLVISSIKSFFPEDRGSQNLRSEKLQTESSPNF